MIETVATDELLHLAMAGSVVFGFLYRSALALNRHRGVRILCYHGLVEEKRDMVLERNFHTVQEFRRHLEFLSRCNVVSLEEAPERRRSGKPAIVITFDDGYENNLLAAELLAQKKLPYSVFVSTGVIETNTTIWTVELSLLLLHGQAPALEVFGERYALDTRERRVTAFQWLRRVIKKMPASQRRQTMNIIRSAFPVGESERLLKEWQCFRMATWPQVRQLAASGASIGSHGVWHEIHHEQQEPDVIESELRDSRLVLERELDQPCRTFSFPNGNTNPDSEAALDAAGYELGVTTKHAVFTHAHSLRAVPRLDARKSLTGLVRQVIGSGIR